MKTILLIIAIIVIAVLLLPTIIPLAVPVAAPSMLYVGASEPPSDAPEPVFLPVIMYHAVVADRSRVCEYIITPETFSADMEYLARNGYTTVFPSEVLDFAQFGKPLPDKPVLVTFDDGQCGALHYVLPILMRMNLKANINIEGAFTEKATKEDAHNPAYSYLTWDEIRLLADSEHFEVGNHTYNMHESGGVRQGCRKNSGETLAAYELALNSDVGKLQSLLTSATRRVPVTFAYPYGFVSPESVPLLSQLGLNLLLTCYEKPNYVTRNSGLPLTLNRLNRPGNISTEAYMSKLLHD